MHTFQLTWDTKDEDVTPSEALRTDIVIKILEDNKENDFHQPTKSTIIFNSDKTFDKWKEKIAELKDVMYYSFCQISLGFYDEEPSNIDVVDVTEKAKSRIPDEVTYEITFDESNPESDDPIKQTIRSTLNDSLRNQKPPED